MGYKSSSFRGVTWLALLRGSTRGLTFLRIAILARLLTPQAFGVFGIASLVLSLLEVLTETGINVFLIQKKEEADKYISSAWAVSILRGCVISFILVLSSPLIADFFNSPDSKQLIILIAFVPLIRGFINPSIINIQKNIQFRKEFYLRFVLFSVDSVVAITIAFITRSAESFAYGLILSAVVEVLLSFVLFRPWPNLKFEIDKIKQIISKGSWVTVNGIFSYFAENGDNLAVGRIMTTSSLGLYQVAYRISTLTISEITEVVNKVTFPVYSKFSHDAERLTDAFKKVTLVSTIASTFIGVIIYVFAEALVLLVAGEAWLSTVPVVRVLAVYGVIRTIFGNFSALFLSLERQDYVAKMTFFRAGTLLITVVPLITAFGLMGAAYAMLLSILVEIPVVLFFYKRLSLARK